MSVIPIGDVAFSGFGVLRREPLAVLVWGLALFVLTVLPLAAMFGVMVPWFEELSRLEGETEPDPSRFVGLHLQLMALNPVLMITSLISRVLLTCAIFRAVLAPEDRRFFYLRLGLAELLVGLVYLCFLVLLCILIMVGLIVAIGFAAVAWSASEALAVGLGLLLFVVLIGVVIWLSLRLSMALPMTFAERRFRFFESWELTRGHTLSLLLVGLIAAVMVWLLEILLVGVAALAIIPVVLSQPFDAAAIAAFFDRPPAEWAAALAPWLLLGGLVASIAGAVFYTLFTAPWAAAYRVLAPKAPAEAAAPA